MIRVSGLLCALALLCLPPAGGTAGGILANGATSEVVVTLSSPALAGRTGPTRRGAQAAVEREQARFAVSLHKNIPSARIRWRYQIVLNGAAVVVPQTAIPLLTALPGVKAVDVGASYALASTTAAGTGAAGTWQTGLPNQGAGMKIGFIDDGVDQRHPYFSPTGYTMPPGYPKGQTSYTTAKVIVARAFPPPGAKWKDSRKPFDPAESSHGTHVAGIAAGNEGTVATDGRRLSGVAPMAYIGNYKALTIPTDGGVGLNGNAAEIVAAIEAAVADGMDVINLSIGEPEVEPSRDLVAHALDAAAEAGVVPVVAAGNDFDEFGRGSLSSPGTSERAITVAAVTSSGGADNSSLASFSGSGPTPLSLRLKPDISAPGVDILSSAPNGGWDALSGTSMATPQIAGAAALLLERHPAWSVAEIKAALVGSGNPVEVNGRTAAPTRGGGGLADPLRADAPLILASPASVSFGFVAPGVTAPIQVNLTDAGGGAGIWDVTVETITAAAGAGLVLGPTVSVPGTLELSPFVTIDAAEGDLTGFVKLTRGTDSRRIPFWLRVVRPGLATATAVNLRTPGLHVGDTRGKPSLASRYRYPDVPAGGVISAMLGGPEQVFRVTLTKSATNFGVVIVRRSKGTRVEPRVVSAGDENRLTGYAALPLNLNPYLAEFGQPVLVAGALRPLAGSYDVVFDSATPKGAGSYAFRFWIDDTRPPTARLEHARVRRGTPLVVRVADAGSGVDPTTAKVTIDGDRRSATSGFAMSGSGTLKIATTGLRRGSHRFRLQVSDYQESRNMENVPPILPNTRVLTTTIVVR
jgi:subtilisin family serine protease